MFINKTIPSDITLSSPANNKLETDERLITTDLICEGTVEGLVDKDGNLLKYVSVSNSSADSDLCLGKGVYYNDVPLIDSKLNKLNFVNLGFNISYGEEVSNPLNEFPSTIYRYNQKVYLNESDFTNNALISTIKTNVISFQDVDNTSVLKYDSKSITTTTPVNSSDLSLLKNYLDQAKTKS